MIEYLHKTDLGGNMTEEQEILLNTALKVMQKINNNTENLEFSSPKEEKVISEIHDDLTTSLKILLQKEKQILLLLDECQRKQLDLENVESLAIQPHKCNNSLKR